MQDIFTLRGADELVLFLKRGVVAAAFAFVVWLAAQGVVGSGHRRGDARRVGQ